MALVASGIAADRTVMKPYLVRTVTDPAGRQLSATQGSQWLVATNPATAATVKQLMVDVVNNGSGRRAAIPGVQVAGKTGTAEASKSELPHAWFIGFAPADAPTVAVAVVLENAGVGGEQAAPAAKVVIQSALGTGGRAK
jgi:peptidoglycan glycosyltransferase